MRRRASTLMAGLAGVLSGLAAMVSCGDRTGLGGEPAPDATLADVPPAPDTFVPDASEAEAEASFEAEAEAEAFVEEDVVEEPPGIDVPDVPIINPCPDASATLIYVIGKSNILYSFNPATDSFATIGTVSCPTGSTPFSMAVDRQGIAYVVFENGELFRVDTKTAACKKTKFVPLSGMSPTFGMGFVAGVGDAGGDAGGDQLFVSLDVNGITMNGELATIDTTTFALTKIAFFSPTGLPAAELTGTGNGRLFAFSPATFDGGTVIAQVDPTTAKVVGVDTVPGVVQGGGWAFGFWGGNFYTFTGMGMGGTSTVVTEFDPSTKTTKEVATLTTDTIVGAGVSTCAPE